MSCLLIYLSPLYFLISRFLFCCQNHFMTGPFTFHVVRPSYCRVSVHWHVERAIHTPVSRSIRHRGAFHFVTRVMFDANLIVIAFPEVWKFINDQFWFVFTARLSRFRWSRCFLDLPSLSPAPQLAFFRFHTPSFPFSFLIMIFRFQVKA